MTSFQDRLQVELEQAAARPRPDRRRVVVAVTAAVLVLGVLGGVLLSVGQPTPAAADVEVTRREGVVRLTLVGTEYDADAIERAAREGGLELTVQTEPASPPMVGRFLDLSFDGPTSAAIQRLTGARPGYTGYAVPDDWPGRVRASVGRPARKGEAYARPTDATAFGEPLSCTEILGRPVGAAKAAAHGLTVRWLDRQTVSFLSAEVAETSGHLVARALMLDAKTVQFELTPDGTLPNYTPPVQDCGG